MYQKRTRSHLPFSGDLVSENDLVAGNGLLEHGKARW